jgi:hypothetical protein
MRSGLSFPIGGGVLKDTLQVGWGIQGGGRTMFFNQANDMAWSVDLSVSNMNNHGKRPDIQIPLSILVPSPTLSITGGTNPPVRVTFGQNGVPGVTVRQLNRTYANLGLGREWWVNSSADAPGFKWRVGLDVGGRYGTESMKFQEIQHRTDVIAGLYVAVHSDLEIPWGCVIFQAGVRVEYGYTWSDILQIQNNSDLEDINLLFTAGIRF